jgi:tetratricopeptide (TPR) repeat protein
MPAPPRLIGGVIPLGGYAGPRPPDATVAPPGEGVASRSLAREAYWSGRPDDAELLYRRLVERYPDDPDLYGELGNLYLAQGRDGAAADAYFEAGLRQLRRGETDRARRVADLLALRGDPRGEALRR